jgi:hypothetical protein
VFARLSTDANGVMEVTGVLLVCSTATVVALKYPGIVTVALPSWSTTVTSWEEIVLTPCGSVAVRVTV